MSHITLARQGLEDVKDSKWDEAIAKLSQALLVSNNPAWLVARSKALASLRRFPEALDDANLAWHMAYERNKRPLLVEAHYRRAVAYYRMGQYANADCCCIYAMRLIKGSPAVETDDPKAKWADARGFWTATLQDAMDEARADDFNRSIESTRMAQISQIPQLDATSAQISEWRLASTLRMQILRCMESLPADDEARKVTVNLKPDEKKLANVMPTEGTTQTKEVDAAPPAATKAPPVVPSDATLRLQEFQSNTVMSVSIFSKGVDAGKLQVEFLPTAVRLDPVVWPSGEKKEFRLQLWGEIDPSASKYTVTLSKVELSLAKKSPGKWPQLQRAEGEDKAMVGISQSSTGAEKEKVKQVDSTTATSSDAKAPSSPPKPQAGASAPSYPSSSRSGPKDWDKIGKDEVGDDETAGDVNGFFKNLYKNATPEQQRAMMKSFTESNGTSLSTDWDDVKTHKVETKPPEGVEAKKWE